MANKLKKQEVVVVATKYKNQPIEMNFFTKSGKPVSRKNVIKEATKFGPRFFYL